jgi:hypothetical protein
MGVNIMGLTEDAVGEPEPPPPSWAAQVRHPDPDTTEFWRDVGSILSSDYNETVAVAVVQNGCAAPMQILVAGIRFTQDEAIELATDALVAVGIAQRATRA